MVEPTYCPKCKKWMIWGELDEFGIVKDQMEKENIKGTPEKLVDENLDLYSELLQKWFDERKLIHCGCIVMNTCGRCKTKLIIRERD